MSLSFSNALDFDLETKIAEHFPPLSRIFDKSKSVILYPSRRMARTASGKLKHMGVRLIGFGDSDPNLWGTTIDTLPVFSPQQIGAEHRDASVLVASSMYDSEITEMLTNLGCKWVYPMPFLNHQLPEVFVSREYQGAFKEIANPANHDIINQVYQLLADDESRRTFASKLEYLVTLKKERLDQIRSTALQYFDPEIVRLSDQEVFVDGGAFTGDTLTQFLQLTNGAFRTYHAFEPDSDNFSRLLQFASPYPHRIFPIQMGLAEHTGNLRFLMTSTADAKFVDNNDPSGEPLPVVKLDEYFASREKPTFIKMDIEGFELPALRGATQILIHNHPILAVSIYHYPGDLWNIPYLIHEFNPGYRLFIRHYTREIDDTVCYAIPIERQVL